MPSNVTGGSKLKAALARMTEQFKKSAAVEIGFIGGRTYPDGTPVAMVAATQEFGGRINVPEHDTTIYRKIDDEGEFLYNGRFVKRSKSNFASDHTIPAHSITIPPRPYFRNMIKKNSGNWAANLVTALKNNNYDASRALDLLGHSISDQLQDSIRSNIPPPNAKSTVKGKGSSQTLIDSGLMLNSVTHLVK